MVFVSQVDARKIIAQSVKALHAQALSDLSGTKFKPRLTKGEFYVRRSKGRITSPSAAAKKAVQQGAISQRFVSVASRWGIRFIEGH